MKASTEDGEDSRLSLSREYCTISIAVVVSTTKFIVTVGTLQFSNTAKSRPQMNPSQTRPLPRILGLLGCFSWRAPIVADHVWKATAGRSPMKRWCARVKGSRREKEVLALSMDGAEGRGRSSVATRSSLSRRDSKQRSERDRELRLVQAMLSSSPPRSGHLSDLSLMEFGWNGHRLRERAPSPLSVVSPPH